MNSILELAPYPLDEDAVRPGFRYVKPIHGRVCSEIDASFAGSRDETFDAVLHEVLQFSAQEFKDPSLRSAKSEEECRRELARYLRARFDEGVDTDRVSGGGKIDIVADGVVIELKRATALTAPLQDQWLRQVARYISAEGKRVGFLIIFDFTRKQKAPDHLDHYVTLKSIQTHDPDETKRHLIGIVKVLVPYYEDPPSRT